MSSHFNLRSFLTFLSRNKGYAAVNIFGMSLSLAFIILIATFLTQSYSIGDDQKNRDRIYLLATKVFEDNKVYLPGHQIYLKGLVKDFPEIEAVCAVNGQKNTFFHNGNGTEAKAFFVDTSFFSIFDYPLEEGSLSSCIHNPDEIAISRTFANKIFGTENPIGKTISLENRIPLRISAVFRDFGKTSLFFQPDVIISFSHNDINNVADMAIYAKEYGVNLFGSFLFVMTKPSAKLEGKEEALTKHINSVYSYYDSEDFKTMTVPVRYDKIYMSDYDFNEIRDVVRGSDNLLISMLVKVCLVILLFAMMNYVNLTVALSVSRSKEMATRRLFGAGRKEIMRNLIMESLTMSAVAGVLAVIVAAALLPLAGSVLSTAMNAGTMFGHPLLLGFILAVILVEGILAGIIPAIIISRPNPIDVVRGTFRRQSKMVFSKIFIVVQLFICIVFMTNAFTQVAQIRHLMNLPLGYETDHIMTLTASALYGPDGKRFCEEVKKLPFVTDVTRSSDSPLDGGNNITFKGPGNEVQSFQIFSGDRNYLKFFGFKMIHEFNPDLSPAYYVSESTLAKMGMTTEDMRPSEKLDTMHVRYFFDNRKTTYNGCMPDFRKLDADISDVICAMVYIDDARNYSTLSVKVTGDEAYAYREVCNLYREIFHQDLNMEHPYMHDEIRANYSRQIRMSRLMSAFAFVAMMIAFLGLMSMSTYFMQQKRREMAVRKVFGSKSAQINLRLLKTFAVYGLVAFVIAVPVVWRMVGSWLMNYQHRVSFWPYLLLAGVMTMAISLMAVYVQSHVIANENPIDNLKQE